MKQWEIWKAKNPRLEKDHWYVIISPPTVIDSTDPLLSELNALMCRSLRSGEKPKPQHVVLNGADGFEHLSVCQCHYQFSIPRTAFFDKIGTVTVARRQAIGRTRVSSPCSF